MKILTVVVSCYNCSKTIKATLESIPATGKDDFEVMIIDDGSTEDILPIIQPFLDKYPDTMKYVRKENGGHGSCINYSIKHANSRYVAYLDSDDTYNPVDFNIVLSLLKRTDENTDLVLLNYNMVFVSKNGNQVKKGSISNTSNKILYKSYDEINVYSLFTLHSSIYRLELLKQIHDMPEKVSYEDNVLYYEVLLRAKKIAYLHKLIHLYNYFIYGEGQQSISIHKIVKKLNDMIVVYKYALTLPIRQFPKDRDKVVRKMFNIFIGFLLVGVAFNDDMTKQEKGKIGRGVFALYKDFLETNKHKSVKPIIYTVFAKSVYGGTNWLKTIIKFFHFDYLSAVLYNPKNTKIKKQLEEDLAKPKDKEKIK